MAADIKFNFEDNKVEVLREMRDGIDGLLLEVSAEIVAQTAKNTRVRTGQLKGSWAANVTKSDDKYTATIGSPLQNAIWEEFGTGEWALNGDGRKGGWAYTDPKTGDRVWTIGKRPSRAFWNAYNTLKNKIINHMQSEFKRRLL